MKLCEGKKKPITRLW